MRRVASKGFYCEHGVELQTGISGPFIDLFDDKIGLDHNDIKSLQLGCSVEALLPLKGNSLTVWTKTWALVSSAIG